MTTTMTRLAAPAAFFLAASVAGAQQHGTQHGAAHGTQHGADHAAHHAAHHAAKPAAPLTGKVGTLIVAHGGGPTWDAQVDSVARMVKTDGPVAVAFLMGPGAKTARFQDKVKALVAQGAQSIAVVPMLVSSHSGHYNPIRWLAGEPVELDSVMHHHLHMAGITRAAENVPMRVLPGLDDAPEVGRVLAERARTIAGDPTGRALFVVGHGPNSAEDYAAWMGNLRRVVDTLKATAGFADVRVDLVRDDAPPAVRAEAVTRVRELITLQRMVTGKDVVVVPVLISTGQVSRVKIVKDLQGLPMVYTGDALLPHPLMARYVERRVREARAQVASRAAQD